MSSRMVVFYSPKRCCSFTFHTHDFHSIPRHDHFISCRINQSANLSSWMFRNNHRDDQYTSPPPPPDRSPQSPPSTMIIFFASASSLCVVQYLFQSSSLFSRSFLVPMRTLLFTSDLDWSGGSGLLCPLFCSFPSLRSHLALFTHIHLKWRADTRNNKISRKCVVCMSLNK